MPKNLDELEARIRAKRQQEAEIMDKIREEILKNFKNKLHSELNTISTDMRQEIAQQSEQITKMMDIQEEAIRKKADAIIKQADRMRPVINRWTAASIVIVPAVVILMVAWWWLAAPTTTKPMAVHAQPAAARPGMMWVLMPKKEVQKIEIRGGK